MHFSGPATLADTLGDFVAFRSLRPCDPRIDWQPPARLPRKIDPDYGALVLQLIQAVRAVDRPDVHVERLLVIGDNAATDGAMFLTASELLPGPSFAIILDETGAPVSLEHGQRNLWRADGWRMLRDWPAAISDHGAVVDERTAVVLDIDKTLLGPRGRNSAVIDRTRSRAMAETIRGLVAARWDEQRFDAALATFNQGVFHPFTGDNQDLVALLCLLVTAGIEDQDWLARSIQNGRPANVDELLSTTQQVQTTLPIRDMLNRIADRIHKGDPTPFKEFREREYRATVQSMNIASEVPEAQRLQTELCLCGEVLQAALTFQAQGAVLVALSDKPDEAALPSPILAREGFLPLHHIAAHIVSADDDDH